MTRYAQHPESKVKIALNEIRPWEEYAPRALQHFLNELNLTQSSDEVWELYLNLALELGQTVVTYGYLRYSTHADAEVVLRTNLPDEWGQISNAVPNFSYFDYGRMHIASKITSFLHGIEFLDLYEGEEFCTPEYVKIVEKAAEFNMRSGLFIPFRSSLEDEKGGSAFLGAMSRDDFLALLKEHGWTMQVAALQTHIAYQRHLKRAEAEKFDLTERQVAFLRLSANGLSFKEIAHKWQVTDRAVAKHARAISARFGAQSKMAVMARAIRLGIVYERDFEGERYLSTDWI